MRSISDILRATKISVGIRSPEADAYIADMEARQTPSFVTFNAIKLRIDRNVYPTGSIAPMFHRAILHPRIEIDRFKSILDYGTGTGFLAIAAAKQGAHVVALDKSPAAIECAKHNAEINNVSDLIEFRLSNCLSAVSQQEKFDIVLAGMPWENAEPRTELEKAFYDPEFIMRRALAEQSNTLLKPSGSMLFSYAKRVQELAPLESFFPDCDAEILEEEIIHDEPHYIMRLKPKYY